MRCLKAQSLKVMCLKVLYFKMLCFNVRCVFFLLLFFPAHFVAADFIVDNPLKFGEIAIRSNAIVSTVSISRTGSQISTGHIFVIHPGEPGVFTLVDFPPFAVVNLSVDLPAFSNMSYPNTAQFEISAVDIPSSVNLGGTGSAQFKMGGTLRTSGNPANNYHSGADYLLFLNLNIDY